MSPAPERFTFSVAYEPSLLRAAARAQAGRALLRDRGVWLRSGLVALVVVGVAFWLGGPPWAIVGLGYAVAIVALNAAYGMWSASRNARPPPLRAARADFAVDGEGVEIAGLGRVRWDAVREIAKFRRFWLLTMGPEKFVTLPLAGVPAEALAFIDARIQPRR